MTKRRILLAILSVMTHYYSQITFLCILHHLTGKNIDFKIDSKVYHSISQHGDHKPAQGFTFTPAALCYHDTCCDVMFLCQSVISRCSMKTSGSIKLFLLWWLPMTSRNCVVRNFLILAVHNILSDIACLHGPSA